MKHSSYIKAAWVFCVLVFGVTAIFAVSLNQFGSLKTSSGGSQVELLSNKPFDSTISSATNPPNYPNATNVRTWTNRLDPGVPTTIFNTSSSPKDVAAFYKEHLLKDGWLLSKDFSDQIWGGTLEFFWPKRKASGTADDAGDQGDYVQLDLVIGISAASDPDATAVVNDNQKLTSVDISIMREPVLEKTPLYPGAENVMRKRDALQSSGENVLISYSAKASPLQIEDYYKTVLPRYGWQSGQTYGDSTLPIRDKNGALQFTCIYSFEGRKPIYSVSIATREDTSGLTSVELRLSGVDN